MENEKKSVEIEDRNINISGDCETGIGIHNKTIINFDQSTVTFLNNLAKAAIANATAISDIARLFEIRGDAGTTISNCTITATMCTGISIDSKP